MAVVLAASAASLAACGGRTSRSQASARTPGAPPAVDAIVSTVQAGRPVIVLGLDGADWPLLDGYIARGVMPNLGAARALKARAATSKTLSPAALAAHLDDDDDRRQPARARRPRLRAVRSGERAEGADHQQRAARAGDLEHGDRGGQAVGGVRPVGDVSRRKRSTASIVSDRLFTFLFKESAPPGGVVFPADREAWARDGLAARRVRPSTTRALHAYLPWLTRGGLPSRSPTRTIPTRSRSARCGAC